MRPTGEMKQPEYSIVIPVFNEESVIRELYSRLNQALSSLPVSHEIIFVDDNSNDGTPAILLEIHKRDKNVKVLRFSRNFGHQMAISAGLERSIGKAVITMDGDLQDPPEVIRKFIEKHNEGFDVVYAIRRKRKEGIIKKSCYKIFYRLLKAIANVHIPPDAGDFCLMDRKIVDILNGLPERLIFLRGLRSWVGFKQTGVEYERDGRHSGESKYSFNRLMNLAADGFFGFSLFPLRMAVIMGFLFSLIGVFLIMVVLYIRIFTTYSIPGFASISILIILFSGAQIIILGVVGEYIGRILTQVNMRPKFIIQEEIGFLDSAEGSS